MKYLLDTNICIFALKQVPKVRERMMRHKPSEIALSVITEAELRTGAAKSPSPETTLAKLERFLSPLRVLDFTSRDALVYAEIHSKLEHMGRPIGPLDTLIAAQAVANQLVLVTHNEREFRRVEAATIENWAL